ncbi:MAG: disulfide bond formation protein B [Gammaproteobacteria bacterium]
MITSQRIFLLIFLACTGLMGFGFYLQYVKELEPCVLCMIQRLFFVMLGTTALLAFLHNPGRTGTRIYAILTSLFSAFGAGIAGRQIWLQHLPADKVPECGPDLFFMLEVYPLTEALMTALKGTGDCAKVAWTFLGFSIPEWAIVIFIGIFLASLYLVFKPSNYSEE